MLTLSPPFLRSAFAVACATALVGLSGCGVSGTAVPSSASVALPKGSVHGGQQPILGAHVYVMAAGNTGYTSASSSLITTGDGSDGTGGYVLTDSGGGFNFGSAGVTCNGDPTNEEIYLLAKGGNPSGQPGPSNTALVLVAPLGPCASINSSTFVNINEVTTVAMAASLLEFMSDGSHVGTSSGNLSGIELAFQAFNNLVDLPTGSALAVTPGGNGTVPQAEINTLANIIEPCANSTGPTSPSCMQLFTDANPSGGAGAPSDTLGAALNIAAFPGSNVTALYSDSMGVSAFQPALTGATPPNDFSIGVTYDDPGLIQPGLLVVDTNGNIWSANCQSCVVSTAQDSIVEFSPTGTVLATYSNVGIHHTQGLAIDAAGNLWTVNQSNGTRPDELTKMSTVDGSLASGFPIHNNDFNGIMGVATDASNNVWLTSNYNSVVHEFNASGVAINGSPFYTGTTGITNPTGVGIDNSSDVWVAATGSNSLLKLNSTGGLVSPSGGYTAAGLSSPLGIALTETNAVWTVDNHTNQVSNISSTGTNVSGSPFALALYQAAIIAIDGKGEVFIPNCRAGCTGSGSPAPDELVRAGTDGHVNTGGPNGFQNAGFNGIGSAAIDQAGNIWVANSAGSTLTQVYGLAAPVVTPLGQAVASHLVGYRP